MKHLLIVCDDAETTELLEFQLKAQGYGVWSAVEAAMIIGFLSLMAFLVQDGGQAKRAYFERLKEHYGEIIARRRAALEIQAKQEFFKDLGQDVRAPINSIIGMTALLLDEKLGKRSREIAETIRTSSNSLLNLIGNIPGAIKVGHESPDIELGGLDLKQCVLDVMNFYSPEAREKGLEVTVQLENIPDNVISCDQSQLEQVLANLMANALKFTDKGSITLSSSCDILQNGAVLIEFAIADTSLGIPLELRESVFNPFGSKGAKTSSKFGGDGLGLPLSKGLVELMGGDIWIEGNQEQGTIVKFTLRAELDPADESWERVTDPAQVEDRIAQKKQHAFFGNLSQIHPHSILVVDDDIHRQIVCV